MLHEYSYVNYGLGSEPRVSSIWLFSDGTENKISWEGNEFQGHWQYECDTLSLSFNARGPEFPARGALLLLFDDGEFRGSGYRCRTIKMTWRADYMWTSTGWIACRRTWDKCPWTE